MKIRCPNPAHEDRNPSCEHYNAGKPDERWYCFACDWQADRVQFDVDINGLSMRDALEKHGKARRPVKSKHTTSDRSNPDSAKRTESYARHLWNTASDATDTPVAFYLRERAIPRIPKSIRYTPVLSKRTNAGETIEGMPAMIVLVTDPNDDFMSVQVSWLERKGFGGSWSKHQSEPKNRNYGPKSAGSAKFGRQRVKDGWIAVAEGPETALSTAIIHGVPAEAVLGIGNLKNWRPPAAATSVILSGERDKSEIWIEEEQRIAGLVEHTELHFPPGAMDDNDLLLMIRRGENYDLATHELPELDCYR